MGTVEAEIVSHYGHGSLRSTLLDGLEAMGKGPETVSMDDLAAVDEFYMGGRAARPLPSGWHSGRVAICSTSAAASVGRRALSPASIDAGQPVSISIRNTSRWRSGYGCGQGRTIAWTIRWQVPPSCRSPRRASTRRHCCMSA